MTYKVDNTIPTHLLAKIGDRRSICGIKDALPRMWAEKAHRHKYPHAKCEECYRGAGLDALLENDGIAERT